MKNTTLSWSSLQLVCTISLGLGLLLASPLGGQAQDAATLATRHTFDGLAISAYRDSVVSGGDGNFYGVTDSGGANNTGEVFKLTPDGTLTTLYSFAANSSTLHSPLTLGSDGNLYGTSETGDANYSGTVYQITPQGVLTVLHSFNGDDGYLPTTALVQGRDGNFYGTVPGSNPYPGGLVYKISPTGAFTILHGFTGYDGFSPYAPLVQARDGSFYGTTDGAYDGEGLGTVFKITPAGEFTDLYHFSANDGDFPNAALVEGNDGSFYGTTTNGAKSTNSVSPLNIGTVFKVTPAGKFTTLHTFTGGLDGARPSGLTLGGDGNFYGTTQHGGIYGQDNGFPRPPGPGYGTIFQITPAGTLTTLYNFTGGADGRNPAGPLLTSGDGSFYDTTGGDGAAIAGTLFKLKVVSHPSFFTGQLALAKGVYYLKFFSGNPFGYYFFLDDPHYLYHFDLGYEYILDANDSKGGIYLYDFASQTFFYTSPNLPFPYLYDFSLNTFLYYYPDPNNAGHYNINGIRYFYRFDTGRTFVK